MDAEDGDFLILECTFVSYSGDLDYDAPVSTYWPEFSQNGKENITVKHLMSHTVSIIILRRRRRIKMQSAYLHFKQTNILHTSDGWQSKCPFFAPHVAESKCPSKWRDILTQLEGHFDSA